MFNTARVAVIPPNTSLGGPCGAVTDPAPANYTGDLLKLWENIQVTSASIIQGKHPGKPLLLSIIDFLTTMHYHSGRLTATKIKVNIVQLRRHINCNRKVYNITIIQTKDIQIKGSSMR